MTNKKLSVILIGIGSSCLVLSITLFLLIFRSVIVEEIRYAFSDKVQASEIVIEEKKTRNDSPDPLKEKAKKTIVAADPYFSIVIPKIGANTKVIKNVDPYNETEYQWQLTKGVAHAEGTAIPGAPGNAFLFAHSAGDFYEANQYNAVFYLLNKLEKGDKIYVVYYKQTYEYTVTGTKEVDPSQVEYLEDAKKDDPTLTLMTCTPAGTSLNRLLVFAELTEEIKK